MKRKQTKKSLILSHCVSSETSWVQYEAPEIGNFALTMTVTQITETEEYKITVIIHSLKLYMRYQQRYLEVQYCCSKHKKCDNGFGVRQWAEAERMLRSVTEKAWSALTYSLQYRC